MHRNLENLKTEMVEPYFQSKEKKSAETGILDEEGIEVLIQERNLLENDLR